MKRIQSKIYASSDEDDQEEAKDSDAQMDSDGADSEAGEDEDVDMDSDASIAKEDSGKKVKAERGGKKALRE